MTRLVVICGPTASGKSAAAVAIAERIGGEIVSCDSLAVYRTLDVGTAKPTAEERARVPHHVIDVAWPDEDYTAARYVVDADAALSRIARPVVCGGTGLYLRALLEGLFPSPPPDPQLRARLKEEARERGWPALHGRLATVDPVAAARISPTDPVRIERALEVYEQTGRPISEQQAARAGSPRHDALVFVVEPETVPLDARIAGRVHAMLAAGLVDETRAALSRWGRVKPLAAVGYREVVAHLDGALDAAALPEAIRLATRHFARRQRTWFRKQPGERVADPAALVESATTARIARFFE